MSVAMMAITTRSSTSVKARRESAGRLGMDASSKVVCGTTSGDSYRHERLREACTLSCECRSDRDPMSILTKRGRGLKPLRYVAESFTNHTGALSLLMRSSQKGG